MLLFVCLFVGCVFVVCCVCQCNDYYDFCDLFLCFIERTRFTEEFYFLVQTTIASPTLISIDRYFISFYFPEYLEENRRINNKKCSMKLRSYVSMLKLNAIGWFRKSDGTWRQTHNRQVYFGEIISLKLPPNFIIQLAQFKSLSFDTFRKDDLKKWRRWLSMRNKIIVGTYSNQDLALNRERCREKKPIFCLTFSSFVLYFYK